MQKKTKVSFSNKFLVWIQQENIIPIQSNTIYFYNGNRFLPFHEKPSPILNPKAVIASLNNRSEIVVKTHCLSPVLPQWVPLLPAIFAGIYPKGFISTSDTTKIWFVAFATVRGICPHIFRADNTIKLLLLVGNFMALAIESQLVNFWLE